MDGRKLDAILVRMPAGQLSSEMTTHAGEEFVYVLRGQVALTLEDCTFTLNEGDTAHYESTMPHVAQYGRRRGGDRLGRHAEAVLAKAAGRKEKYWSTAEGAQCGAHTGSHFTEPTARRAGKKQAMRSM